MINRGLIDLNNIKLIIWDLDDTFWKGTLSEGPIEFIPENIQLIKDLTQIGIVNSICSKNDLSPVELKLKEANIDDLFVFKSVDWSPKGPRISNLLKDMGLRAINTLFIDDNIVNLEEAKHYENNLYISLPDIIDEIRAQASLLPKKDLHHKRLNQYKILEEKKRVKEQFADNDSFLYASETEVEIHNDCKNEIKRIHELILRTNQLNYTKNRISFEELEDLLNNKDINSGYVTVKDKFGDYGIVGFYALKDEKLIHFLFSCRTIGQGVEQYVYSQLKFPQLDVNGDVIIELNKDVTPQWINNKKNYRSINEESKVNKAISNEKIVFKGPCDIFNLLQFLNSENIISELNYISKSRLNSIAHQCNLTNILNTAKLSQLELDYISEELIFNDENTFKSSIFDKDVKMVIISTISDFHQGIYKNKKTGIKIAFGDWHKPLTDVENWQAYIDNDQTKVWTYENKFTLDFLKKFNEDWEFLGRKTCDEYIEELNEFIGYLSPDSQICILLGSEIPFWEKNTGVWENRHEIYRQLNRKLEQYVISHPRVHLLNFTDYITSSNDYLDSINHFQRIVYYKAAIRLNEIIQEVMGLKLSQKSKMFLYKKMLRDNTAFLYHKIKKIINH